jgi:hypothetical protein
MEGQKDVADHAGWKMNGKQAKRARAMANHEAVKRGLWNQGESSVYSKWWRKILAKLFPKYRNRYTGWVGRWYKATLKKWARIAYAQIHDNDVKSFLNVQRKLRARLSRERMSGAVK